MLKRLKIHQIKNYLQSFRDHSIFNSCLTSGVNFINILWAAFAPVDPKSVKRYLLLDWILTLLGPMRVKAVRRTLMKLSPDCIKNVLAKIRREHQQLHSRGPDITTVSSTSLDQSRVQFHYQSVVQLTRVQVFWYTCYLPTTKCAAIAIIP